MKDILMRIGIFFLRIIYFPMKLFRVKNKIVYISRQFNEETLDFRLLREEIEKIDSSVINVVLARRLEKNFKSRLRYIFHMFRQMYHISTSKVVIVDTYCIVVSVLKHKKCTKVIQIWHALGAIKKFGYQTIDKRSGARFNTALVMRMHKNYDYVLCPSRVVKRIYMEAFGCDGNEIKYFLLPRVDYILNNNICSKIYKRYPILRKKKNILYAPTFRKGKRIDLRGIIDNIDTKRYNLIIKLHPLDRRKYSNVMRRGIIFDDEFMTYDLFGVCDKVITDYSSISIEASILNKEIYFYTYDILDYEKDPGLNFNFKKEGIGYYKADNYKELLELIDEEYKYEYLDEFRNKYIDVDVNDCTNKLALFVLELMNDVE